MPAYAGMTNFLAEQAFFNSLIENAVVPAEKMIGYLLSFSHADGRGKARFFG